MGKKVSMQQIADYLGVSKFVVSKALSGKGGVSEQTKERVIQAASQLGYFAQGGTGVRAPEVVPAAAKPRTRQKKIVIVLMPNIRFQTRESTYWGKIVNGISAKLEEDGLGILIVSEHSVDHFMDILNPKGIMGLIGVGAIASSLLLEIHRMGIPMVLVDHEDALIPTDTVFVNNTDCMYRLTRYMIGLGHRELQFVGSNQFSRSFKDRWIGFRTALEEELGAAAAGEERLLTVSGLDGLEAQAQVTAWASRAQTEGRLPSAWLCANDFIAIAVAQALAALGLNLPGDAAITGFDNIEDAYRHQPPLTTVNVPKETLGRRAVERLLARIAKPSEPLDKLLVNGEMLYRESTLLK
ncbi:LacI family transcriptional regulator [Paenibacillus sp. 598K]|uniref:LacI family DNA-binding transcriptional regulator n=1 Tax=Paenibacillus sp. 598K TaxID=1117987 RepID=UPI000FF9B25E|nr:LacI family DNA-binding transcriptional regulator [Paenibacillus sp. 598K]GBF72608.1 LacI family transcriptional regulator [Paenibacillus sp. 598K]